MNKTLPYIPFNRFVFRAPAFPVNDTSEQIFKSKIFIEGIRLASPDFFKSLEAYLDYSYDELPEKIRLSVFKYILRAQHRCTPFGLFAGCGMGIVGDKVGILLNRSNNYKTTTRLDMTYLHSLSKYISELEGLQNKLTYYPNDSLFRVEGVGYRLIEYKYVNGERKYFLSEIESNDDIDNILKNCQYGKNREELAKGLIDNEIDEQEAFDYIQLLVENQILVADLGVSSAGEKDILQKILDWSKPFTAIPDKILKIMESTGRQLLEIDRLEIGRNIKFYEKIEDELRGIDLTFNSKYLFQSDLSVYPKSAQISVSVMEDVLGGLRVLNMLTPRSENQILKKFKSDFYRRYESEEIPLLEALDVDIGVMLSNMKKGATNINPLIDTLGIVEQIGLESSNSRGKIDRFLLKKYHACIKSNLDEVILTDEDLNEFTEDWSDLSETFYALTEFKISGNLKGDPLILIKAAGGSSAGNLLGRFCHSHPNIDQFVREIVNEEEGLLKEGQVLAEIVHLPQFRTGNITYRPNLRSFQIPFLTINTTNEVENIPISDLVVFMPNVDSIIIKSKSLNKRVIPRLTNAHNFSNDSLSIYNFLGLLQMEGKREGLYFSWGNSISSNSNLPRVRYKNIILSPAKWSISPLVVKTFIGNDDSSTYRNVIAYKQINKIADKVFMVKGDNKLLIDFGDSFSVKLLVSEANSTTIILEEYLYDYQDMFIEKEESSETYTNEVLLFFKKNI